MKARIYDITHAHPKAASNKLRRVFMHSYEIDAYTAELINRSVPGTIAMVDRNTTGEKYTIELHVMAVRVAVVTADDIGLMLDVVDDEMLDVIRAWIKNDKRYTLDDFVIRPDHYEEWAREHKVWL